MAAIEFDGVRKEYRGVTALDGLDLCIADGDVFGLLGPNGAGKSTAIGILLDYRRPTAGSVRIRGQDPTNNTAAVKRDVGVLPEGFEPFTTMTGRQHVAYSIKAADADQDPESLLSTVGLKDAADRQARRYSKGMKQRLALAMALAGSPPILVLDEPSTGLDPHGIKRMRTIIRQYSDNGGTVLFSSHILDQVEAVCDRVGILRDGSLRAVDTIDSLRDTVGARDRLEIELDGPAAPYADRIAALDGVGDVSADGSTLVVDCDSAVKLRILDFVRKAGGTVTDFSTEQSSLEDLFVEVTR